jgi:hypothetical protein
LIAKVALSCSYIKKERQNHFNFLPLPLREVYPLKEKTACRMLFFL